MGRIITIFFQYVICAVNELATRLMVVFEAGSPMHALLLCESERD